MNNENVMGPVNNISSEKKTLSLGMMTVNFIGGFIIYQLIMGIIMGAINSVIFGIVEKANLTDTVTNIILIIVSVIAVIVMDVLSVYLAVWSTFRKHVITKEIISKSLRNILIFLGVIIIISGLGGYYSDDTSLINGLINFFGSLVALVGMTFYIKKKLNDNSI